MSALTTYSFVLKLELSPMLIFGMFCLGSAKQTQQLKEGKDEDSDAVGLCCGCQENEGEARVELHLSAVSH